LRRAALFVFRGLMAAHTDLNELINWGKEQRQLEYKSSLNWGDPAVRAKLTKSVLALANLRGGGYIVVGVAEQKDGSYAPVGVNADDLETFSQDNVSAHVAEFADPYVEVTVLKHTVDSKSFVILQVNEFAELPIICKRDGAEKLRRGATYVRARRIPETVEVPGQVEMREILDLAIEKRSRTFALQAGKMGYSRPPDIDLFAKQRGALPAPDLLQQIRGRGSWRVQISPSEFEQARFQTLAACRSFMIQNVVQIGGWQYPRVSEDRVYEGSDWIACDTDFPPYQQVWTLFRSGQFVDSFAMVEEFLGTDAWPVHPQFFIPNPDKKYLNILETLRTVTAIFEFAARLAYRQILSPEVLLSIEMHGTGGRELAFMTPQRRLDNKYWCRTETIEIEKTLRPEELVARARELALDATIEIFNKFNWLTVPRELLAEDQVKMLQEW
jgi:hypothetical protein